MRVTVLHRGPARSTARHRALDWHRQAARRPSGPLPLDLAVEEAASDDPAVEAVAAESTVRR